MEKAHSGQLQTSGSSNKTQQRHCRHAQRHARSRLGVRRLGRRWLAIGSERLGAGDARYAREALTVLLDHAFSSLGLRRIEADVDPRNQGSLNTLEALGFRREGYLRQRWRVAGEIQDSVLMGLLASEWPSAR